MGKSILDMRATFRDEVHVISPFLRPDGSHNTYTIPRERAKSDCFVTYGLLPFPESPLISDDGWEGY